MNKYIIGAVFAFVLLVSPSVTQAAGLSSSQVQAILSLLSSFGADQSVINNVSTALGGTPIIGAASQSWCHTFNTDLSFGQENNEVGQLQVALNKDGTFHPGSGSSAYSSNFNESLSADVVSFQAKYGIRQTGYVGPITRAKLNALHGCESVQQSIVPPADSVAPAVIPQPTQSMVPPPVTHDRTPSVISYVLSPNNPVSQKVLLAGQDAAIVGTNFPTTYTPSVNIGSYSTSGQTSSDGTQISFTVPAIIQPGTYNLNLSTQKGALTNTVTVVVGSLSAPKVDLKINGVDGPLTGIAFGDIVNLTWTSTNASSCVASSNNMSQWWSGSKATNGRESLLMPASDAVTYVMSCVGASGVTASDSVQLR